MSWSATEFKALSSRAARGAGAPPWQAEMFGAAAVQHLLAEEPIDVLDAALAALPEGPVLQIASLLLALQGRPGAPIELTENLPVALVRSYAASQSYSLVIDTETGTATAFIGIPRRPVIGRIEAPDAFISSLKALAERTFVPESDQSRAAGAGAALSDND
ncbi:MAG: hypothetical protein AAF636_01520 [Pseudomonadota bacterium]